MVGDNEDVGQLLLLLLLSTKPGAEVGVSVSPRQGASAPDGAIDGVSDIQLLACLLACVRPLDDSTRASLLRKFYGYIIIVKEHDMSRILRLVGVASE
jgi:hypothetical protein